ncbi:hypothetical protein MKX62_04090 [Sporosarcina sp. FSL K6-5500]
MKIFNLDENVHVLHEERTNEELFLSLKSIHHKHYALPVRRCLVVRTTVTTFMLMTYPFQILLHMWLCDESGTTQHCSSQGECIFIMTENHSGDLGFQKR